MDPRPVVLLGPPGYPALVLPPPRRFTLRARLEPAGIFGLDEEGVLVLPSPREGVVEESIRIPSGGDGAPRSSLAPAPFHFEMEMDGVAVRIDGNVAQFEIQGMKGFVVLPRLTTVLRRLLESLSVSLAMNIRAELEAFIDERDGTIDLPKGEVLTVTYYDLPTLDAAFEWSRGAAACQDNVFRRAVQYFLSGCSVFDSWEATLRSRGPSVLELAEPSGSAIWTSAYLQFWKALTVILDEPSKDPRRDARFVRRCATMSLTETQVTRIRSLKEIRDDFDVAHRTEDEHDHYLARRNVAVVRETAQEAILAYQARLARGEEGFSLSDEEQSKRRAERRSVLRRVHEPTPRRIGRLVVDRTVRTGRAGYSELDTYQGRDTVILRFPRRVRMPPPNPGRPPSESVDEEND